MTPKRDPYNRPTDEQFFGDIGGLKPNMSASSAIPAAGAVTAPAAPYDAAAVAAWQTIIDDFRTLLNLMITEMNTQRTALRNS